MNSIYLEYDNKQLKIEYLSDADTDNDNMFGNNYFKIIIQNLQNIISQFSNQQVNIYANTGYVYNQIVSIQINYHFIHKMINYQF